MIELAFTMVAFWIYFSVGELFATAFESLSFSFSHTVYLADGEGWKW